MNFKNNGSWAYGYDIGFYHVDIDETPQFLLEYSTFDYEDDPRRCD